ncbi:MAG TPA: glycosyltransferase family 39 protein [Candidatus Methanoperedens sp.]|nr:glycosyltransferase family 39 protein [Candidatus Methanoperedens sp.]
MKLEKPLLVFLVFVVFILMRMWMLPKTISFGWDQERDAQAVEKIFTQFSLPLIGPRVVGDNGFYLGPYFYYLLAPFYLISSLHPQAMIYFIAFTTTIFFILTFIVFQKLYGQKVTLLFLAIWSFLPATVTQDRISWNPILIPLMFSCLIFTLDRLKNNKKYFIILGLILGLIFHIHFQGLFYLVFTLIYLISKNNKNIKYFFWLLFGFALTFLPLIVFDLRHQGINFNLFINFFSNSDNSVKSIGAFLPVWSNFINLIIGINSTAISIIFWSLLLLFGFINRQKPYIFSFTLLLFITPIAFMIYGKRPSEYYFNYLLPIIILYLSIFISQLKLPYYLIIPLYFLFSFNSFKSIRPSPTSLFYKNDIVQKAKEILQDKSVYISYDTPLGENNGFDYLIKHYKISRSNNPNDPGVQFIIPKKELLPTSGDISLFIPSQF